MLLTSGDGFQHTFTPFISVTPIKAVLTDVIIRLPQGLSFGVWRQGGESRGGFNP